MSPHKFSFVIPVYNRPDEIEELLDSVCNLEFPENQTIPFEVVIVEDGSTIPCKNIVDRYKDKFEIQYFMMEKNSGYCVVPRNFGSDKATGDYLIFLDSDILLHPKYLIEVNSSLAENDLDAYGGPDMAHSSFNNMQKATSYAMTAFFTTGGIRNKKKPLSGKYTPRGFNYAIKKDVFMKMEKFPIIMPGEDILLGHKLIKQNYKVGLIENAIVYHKRRATLKKYFKQVFLFGRGRVNLNIKLPETTSIVHYLPSLFTLFCIFCIASSFFCIYAITPLLLYALLILVDSTIKNKNLIIGGLSVITAYIQHFGYGIGFIFEFISKHILKQKDKAIDEKYHF
jgi:glycosyltransferase involved in cell wall biosynthesis